MNFVLSLSDILSMSYFTIFILCMNLTFPPCICDCLVLCLNLTGLIS